MSCELVAVVSLTDLSGVTEVQSLVASTGCAKVEVGPQGPQGATGPQGVQGDKGDQGDPGESYLNIDGGNAFSIYGGVPVIDGGNAFN